MAVRRRRDVEQVDVSDMTPDERRELFLNWWYRRLAAQERAVRTGDRRGYLAWLREHPKPTPNRYDHLRGPGG